MPQPKYGETGADPGRGVNPESGEVVLVDEHGEPVASPTEEIGVPKLDHLAEGVARVFDLGALVSIDKLSRIPPLEALVKPEWFGVDSFRQTGMVRAQTSIKVAPFDESTLKKIDRLRRVSGELLPRYSFALADGVRWIPRQAIPLFEAALTTVNEDAKKLLGATVGESVDDFLVSQRDAGQAQIQRRVQGQRGHTMQPARQHHSGVAKRHGIHASLARRWAQLMRLAGQSSAIQQKI